MDKLTTRRFLALVRLLSAMHDESNRAGVNETQRQVDRRIEKYRGRAQRLLKGKG